METRKGIIYKATNKTNGKIYIGQTTKSLKRRIKYHKYNSKKTDNHFMRAVKKYGTSGFDWKIICDDILKEYLDEYEIFYIDFYSSYKYYYNSDLGGKGVRGYKYSAKDRKKISDGRKGKKLSEETKRKISKALTGRKRPPFSKETREAMSRGQRGKKGHTEESKKKISEANKGEKNGMYGKKRKPLTKEHKMAIIRALTGRIVTKETREKISKTNTGRKHTEETKRKISKTMIKIRREGKNK